MKFKKGDRVKRIKTSFLGMQVGDIGTVEKARNSGSVLLKEYQHNRAGYHDSKNLILVDKDTMPSFDRVLEREIKYLKGLTNA